MKKKYILPVGLAALLVLVGNSAFAYRGNPDEKGPNYTPERHALMQEAFNNNDYNSWKELMAERGNVRVVEVINEENFESFAKIRSLMIEGKIEEAKLLRQELGLGQQNGPRRAKNLRGGGNGYRRNQ